MISFHFFFNLDMLIGNFFLRFHQIPDLLCTSSQLTKEKTHNPQKNKKMVCWIGHICASMGGVSCGASRYCGEGAGLVA